MTKCNPWFIPACSDKQFDDDLTQENRDQELINAVNNMPSKEIFNEILSNSLENRDEVKSCGKSMWDGILERCRLFSRNEKEFQECLRGELGWHWSRPSCVEPVLYAEHFAKTELNTMNENRKDVLNMNALPTTLKIDAWVDIDKFKDGQNLATPKYLDGYYPLYDFRIDNDCAITIDKIGILINDVLTVISTNMCFDSNNNYTIKNNTITLGSTKHGRDRIDTIDGWLDPNTCILTLITMRGRVDQIHISGTVNGYPKKVELGSTITSGENVEKNVNDEYKGTTYQLQHLIIDMKDAQVGIPLASYVSSMLDTTQITCNITIIGAYMTLDSAPGKSIFVPTNIPMNMNDDDCALRTVTHKTYDSNGNVDVVTEDTIYCFIAENAKFRAYSANERISSIVIDGTIAIKNKE